MIELQLFLNGDSDEANRLRMVLAREGFRVDESPDGSPACDPVIASTATADDVANGSESTARRIEELEMTLRELRNLDVAKSQFLANVSHELRTPLTAIVTYGEVLRDGLLGEVNDRQHEALESVIGSSRQLLSMIEEILTYAKTNARAIELEPTEFELKDAIRDVHRMNASLVRKKHIDFETRLGEGLPLAQADRDKVLHVLGNLIGNAIEFTPPGGVIRVEADRCPRDSAWLQVVVADTGIGIRPAPAAAPALPGWWVTSAPSGSS